MIGGNTQTFPDAIGDRYRGDIAGRQAFYQGWAEADVLIAVKALDLVMRELENCAGVKLQ
jgi:hypothetical protein